MQNGFVERFNRRLRDECLNEHMFSSLAERDRSSKHRNWFQLLIQVFGEVWQLVHRSIDVSPRFYEARTHDPYGSFCGGRTKR